MMPNGDPWDGFFYPTLMIDSYISYPCPAEQIITMANSLLNSSQLSCMISINIVDAEDVWKTGDGF